LTVFAIRQVGFAVTPATVASTGNILVGPVELDQGVQPAEQAPVEVQVGVEDIGGVVARPGRQLIAGDRQDVEVAELLASGQVGGQVHRTMPLEDLVGPARCWRRGRTPCSFPERLEVGAVYSTSIASQHNFDVNGLVVKIAIRY
jgi:hypothetical protein